MEQTEGSASVSGSKRVGRTLLAALSALILGLSVTAWAASEKYLSALNTVNVFGGLAGGTAWSGEPFNVLIVGSDDRSGLNRKQRQQTGIERANFGRHTDTLMIAHVGGDLGKITVVSIPRDSLVDIPAHTSADGEQIKAYRGKINSAFGSGGPAVTVQAVQNATGLEIDHYVEVNFGGFLDIVKAVDGVEVCLEEPLYDERSGLDLPAGQQTIEGPQALAYVRARYIDNDFGRSQRQQKFLSALAQRVSQSEVMLNPLALNSLLDAVASSITTDERLTRDDMAALAARAAELDLSNIVFTTVPVSDGDHLYDGESTVLWDQDAAPELFAALKADQPLPKPQRATAVEVGPGQIKVAVVGNSVAAEQAATDLTAAGYQVSRESKASDPAITTVNYDPGWPNSLATLQASLPDATFSEAPGSGDVFRIIIGEDYQGLQPVRAAATSVESKVRSAKQSLCE